MTVTANDVVQNTIRSYNLCQQAVDWAKDEGFTRCEYAWNACDKPGWLTTVILMIGDSAYRSIALGNFLGIVRNEVQLHQFPAEDKTPLMAKLQSLNDLATWPGTQVMKPESAKAYRVCMLMHAASIGSVRGNPMRLFEELAEMKAARGGSVAAAGAAQCALIRTLYPWSSMSVLHARETLVRTQMGYVP